MRQSKLHQLFRDALEATRDELDLGLSINPAGELVDAIGRPSGLFALGPLGLGLLPDIDLVPEFVTPAYAAVSLIEAFTRPQLETV